MLEVYVLIRFWEKQSPLGGGCRKRFSFKAVELWSNFILQDFCVSYLVGHHWLCWFTETKGTSGKEAWKVISPGNSSIQGHRCEEGGEAPTPSDEHSSESTRGRVEHSWSIPCSIGSKRTAASKSATKIGLGWGLAAKQGEQGGRRRRFPRCACQCQLQWDRLGQLSTACSSTGQSFWM